jgi:hypothetical protein
VDVQFGLRKAGNEGTEPGFRIIHIRILTACPAGEPNLEASGWDRPRGV